MRIHILFEFKDGPWGGGNQFLKALRNQFIFMGVYSEDPVEADGVIFNSHHQFPRVLELKKRYPNKIFAHRIDGPVFLIRNKDLGIDRDIFHFNQMIADVSIFQSHWSKKQCYKLGYKSNNFEKVIYNASDRSIFNDNNRRSEIEGKVHLIATSWSDNMRKGFDIYRYLDENLDFNKYSFTFVGNSPIKFKNINHITPVPSKELAGILKENHIYMTASEKDPCSNSLIEAINCGLPAVVMNDGGHPELVGDGGEVFDSKENVISQIDKVVQNYTYYRNHIIYRDIKSKADEYLNFIKEVHFKKKSGEYKPKKVSCSNIISWRLIETYHKMLIKKFTGR